MCAVPSPSDTTARTEPQTDGLGKTPLSFQAIQSKALGLGFSSVGLLTTEGLNLPAQPLHQWLQAGYHADMTWMQTHLEKRLDPASLMPNTQSIVVVTMNYYPGPEPKHNPKQPQDAGRLKVARYARGQDYHRVLKQRLKELLAWMKTHDPTIEGRPLTDSAPILEKPLAMQAGLGWQGKHSNLITRTHGSWVFVAELLLNKTFPDTPELSPHPNFCGSCRRCIDACPTQAIVEPYVVDANRCIAYWTIEARQPVAASDAVPAIPDTIAQQLNGWVFGCDICQEVCPWNQKYQTPTTEPAFFPRPWLTHFNGQEWLDMPPERFRIRTRHSPLKRTGLKALQRNVTAALQDAPLTINNPP